MQNENWGLQKRDANPDLPILQWVLTLLCHVYGRSEGAPYCSCSCSVLYINLPPAAQTQRVSVLELAFGSAGCSLLQVKGRSGTAKADHSTSAKGGWKCFTGQLGSVNATRGRSAVIS